MGELSGQEIGRAGLPLRERAVQDLVRGAAVEARHQIDREVVRRPEGGAQVRGRRRCDAGRLRERGFGRPGDDGVTLLVKAAAPGAAGQLQVLPRRQRRAPRTAVLGEAFDHHRTCGHVDAEREGLGGEDDLQQAGLEALLHGFPEGRHQTGMVGRHTAFEALEPLVVAEDPQVLVAEGFDSALGDLTYGRSAPARRSGGPRRE